MIPIAFLILILGGVLAVVVGTLFSRIERLQGRLEHLERRHEDLVNLISAAIVDRDEQHSLELKLRGLLAERQR